jgi:hypothetical protein
MDIKPISGRSSSPIIAYYLRGSETGFFVATDALLNAATTREIELLLESQRMEYVSKTRQSLMKKHLVAERREILDSKSNRVRGSYPNSDNANELARRVHVISQTMLYERPNAKTGCMFRLSLPNETTKEQTLDIIRTIRNHFPANVPAMFTVHYGGRGEDGKTDKNLHLQGWFSVKPWESCGWGAPLKEFTTMEGVRSMRQAIDGIVTDAGADWKKDPLAPKVTVFHPAKARWMRSIPHAELLKANFLKDVQNLKLRECLRQEIEKARFFENKRLREKLDAVNLTYERGLETIIAKNGRDNHVQTGVFESRGVGTDHLGKSEHGKDPARPGAESSNGDYRGDAEVMPGGVYRKRKKSVSR